MSLYLVLSTFPNAEEARQTAMKCVEERLAACASLLPGVESIYHWQGKVEQGEEVLVLFKTPAEKYAALEAKIRELHSYEVPEIIALDVAKGLPDYLAWAAKSTK